ncbi:hypothetical protein [Hyalangium rubrum]|uniref:Lipoprotein n=1 Tax=Hyalangium rubrum TaxID=3103134 RepID=A0ABU5H170_9BACT|nr:hypothetical protein [Hyalangium sp. s54d21]MDY7226664.1 hypothetical protein [Hyalangium sp. s54d21]
MRLALLLSAWACLGLVACAPVSFDSELKGETTVAKGPPGVTTLLNAFPAIGSFAGLDFDQNPDFRNQGVSKDEVSSVKPKAIELRLLSPDDADFGFLDTLEFFAKAGDQEKRFARKQDISRLGLQAPNPVLRMEVEDVELQPFVAAPSMSIIVRGKGRMPEQEVRLQAVVTLSAQVDLL